MVNEKLLKVMNLKKYFSVQAGLRRKVLQVKAVDDISFDIYRGETIGLVGESGCGKSTTGRCAIGLLPATEGFVSYRGMNIAGLNDANRRGLARELQIIFQDPYSSLNPRMTAGAAIEEPLFIHKVCATKAERKEKSMEMFKKVGMREDQYYRFPHELSGGQRQRVGIARALILTPRLIVCDEPVSALDVSIQSQILNLLSEMKAALGMTYLFISHNMSVVRYISDRVGVMYLGRLVEIAQTENLYANPLHPYTQALLSAVPQIGSRTKRDPILLQGDIPSPLNPPRGCVFHTRCPLVENMCARDIPPLREACEGHSVACFRSGIH